MHVLDYDRALGELLELDDTIKATKKHLAEIGELDNTLIIVTADHGHGFDVTGGVDTKYMDAQTSDRKKRDAVGTYEQSGLSQYMVANRSAPIGSDQNLVYSAGVDFPVNWDPRYTLQSGLATFPDHRENYRVHKKGPRIPALNVTGFSSNDYYVNYIDAVTGFMINGVSNPRMQIVQLKSHQMAFRLMPVPLLPLHKKHADSYLASRLFLSLPTRVCIRSPMFLCSLRDLARVLSEVSTTTSTFSITSLLACACREPRRPNSSGVRDRDLDDDLEVTKVGCCGP